MHRMQHPRPDMLFEASGAASTPLPAGGKHWAAAAAAAAPHPGTWSGPHCQ